MARLFLLMGSPVLVAEISWVLMERPLLRLKPAIAIRRDAAAQNARQP